MLPLSLQTGWRLSVACDLSFWHGTCVKIDDFSFALLTSLQSRQCVITLGWTVNCLQWSMPWQQSSVANHASDENGKVWKCSKSCLLDFIFFVDFHFKSTVDSTTCWNNNLKCSWVDILYYKFPLFKTIQATVVYPRWAQNYKCIQHQCATAGFYIHHFQNEIECFYKITCSNLNLSVPNTWNYIKIQSTRWNWSSTEVPFQTTVFFSNLKTLS